MTSNLLQKLQKKTNHKLKLVPVFSGDKNEKYLSEFLKRQTFIKPKKIFSVLKINYIKENPIGYILCKNENQVVGFLGTIFSKRKIKSSLIDHCYLHSWIVDKDYRTQSFRLIAPILDKKLFVSTYSPIKTLEGLYKKLGFSEKTFYTKIILTFPLRLLGRSKAKITDDQSIIKDVLLDDNKKIYTDHLSLKNNMILVYFDNNVKDNIFIIVKKKYKKLLLPVLEIIYVSNLDKFRRNEKDIVYELIKKFKTFIFVQNFFENESALSKDHLFSKLKNKKAYYLNIPTNFNFNFLYSEIFD
jgi:hypothetical protein